MQARGTLVGLTRGSNRNHIIRAALEAMAYQSADVMKVMSSEAGMQATRLAVDGGACANDFLMQFQADVLNCEVLRPEVIESTSLGVAYMAGLKAGIWRDSEELKALKKIDTCFTPDMDTAQRERLLSGWERAVRQCRYT